MEITKAKALATKGLTSIKQLPALLFPGLAARWLHKRVMYQRLYDAAKLSNTHRRPNDRRSPDGVMEHARDNLRVWARSLDENHDLVIGLLDTLVNRIVGNGISIEPMALGKNGKPHKATNKQIRQLLKAWSRKGRVDVTGEESFASLQRLACRSWLRDGEVLSQHVMGRAAGFTFRSQIPYAVELIEADYLPFDLTTDRITHGVEKDQWGRPIGYHVYKSSPGDVYFPVARLDQDTKRVPAENIVHLKFVRRIRQTRGVSVLHGVIHRLDDIKDYEESERIAARVAAALTGFIKKSTDFSTDTIDPATGNRTFEMNPGMIFDGLNPGEEVGTIGSNRPNTGLLDFRNSQLRMVATGTMTNYSSISKDYNGTYSAQRQELVESRGGYDALRTYFIDHWLQPIYSNLIEMAVLSGRLKLAAGVDRDMLDNADMRGPGMPWIDPAKETKADLDQIAGKLKSRHQVIRERGGDPLAVDEQLQLELEINKALEPEKPPASNDGTPGDAPEETDDDDQEAA